MKLKQFLKYMEKEFEDMINVKIDLDLGIDTNMNVINDKCNNRIKFSIIKSKPKPPK